VGVQEETAPRYSSESGMDIETRVENSITTGPGECFELYKMTIFRLLLHAPHVFLPARP